MDKIIQGPFKLWFPNSRSFPTGVPWGGWLLHKLKIFLSHVSPPQRVLIIRAGIFDLVSLSTVSLEKCTVKRRFHVQIHWGNALCSLPSWRSAVLWRPAELNQPGLTPRLPNAYDLGHSFLCITNDSLMKHSLKTLGLRVWKSMLRSFFKFPQEKNHLHMGSPDPWAQLGKQGLGRVLKEFRWKEEAFSWWESIG